MPGHILEKHILFGSNFKALHENCKTIVDIGSGGCLLFYCNENRIERIKTALDVLGGKVLPFRFTDRGLTWTESDNVQIVIPRGRTFP